MSSVLDRLTIGWRPWALLTVLCVAVFLPGMVELPVLDRDEARFAQATRQMLESGNFIDIRFQDDPRYQKPVGIYWLQALSVSLFSDAASTAIWPYRLVSALGATATVLLTFGFGAALFGRRIALLGAALLATSLVLIVEAHIAKTDAVMTALATLAFGALAVVYRDVVETGRRSRALLVAFWLALGFATLLKGPVIPGIAALAVLALAVMDRSLLLPRRLGIAWGLPLALLVVLPWLVAILTISEGEFLAGSVGADLVPKLVGGHQSRGAPPGTFLLVATLTLWPASLLLWPAFAAAVRNRADLRLRAALAWVVPGWIMFELVPSKLPHYTLPLHPALALIMAWAVVTGVAALSHRLSKAWYAVWAVASVAIAGGLAYVPIRYAEGYTPWAVVCAISALVVAAAVVPAWRGRWREAGALGLAGTVGLMATLGSAVGPRLDQLWVSPRVAAIVDGLDVPGPPVSVGFNEPSLVFMLGTDTVLARPGEAAELVASRPETIVIVEERQLDDLRDRLIETVPGATALVHGEITGLNYSRGHIVRIRVMTVSPPVEPQGTEPAEAQPDEAQPDESVEPAP